MLKKLLKYDLASVFRYWWIIVASQVVLALIASAALRLFILSMERSEDGGLITVISVLLLVLACFGIMLAPMLTSLLAVIRFYKNLFTDEGYLTFTLPVSRSRILLSKTLTVMLFSAVNLVFLVGCFFIVLTLGTAGTPYPALAALKEALGSVGEKWGANWLFLAFSSLVFLAACEFFGIVTIFLCITLGATVCKRYKVLGAIGFYYGGNLVLQLVGQVVCIIGMAILSEGLITAFASASVTQPGAVMPMASLCILALAMPIACLGLLLYLLMLRILERKLNLP